MLWAVINGLVLIDKIALFCYINGRKGCSFFITDWYLCEEKNMIFEKAVYEDIDQLSELRIAYLIEDTGNLDEKDLAVIKRDLPDYFERNLNKNIFCYIARKEKQIVACAFLLVVEKPMSPAFITGKTGTVLNVYTKPESRHNGYARKLMNIMLSDVINMDLSSIELKATDAGYSLYKSLRFKDEITKYHLMKWTNSNMKGAGVCG